MLPIISLRTRLHGIYNRPKAGIRSYMWIMQLANAISAVCNWIERGIIWLYDDAVTGLVKGAGTLLQRFNDGSLSRYLVMAVTGEAGIIVIILAIN